MKNTLRWLLSCALLACLCARVLPAQAQGRGGSAGPSHREIVSIGHNAELPAGESAREVISILGSSTVDGDVSGAAVAILGDIRVNGTVEHSAVVVIGHAHINGKINGDVVSLLGSVTLGPQAVVDGRVTTILGALHRSPTAIVQGGSVHILSGLFGNVEGLHTWLIYCLLFGRPLAATLAVAWTWWLAIAALAFYLLVAAVFREGVRRCVGTLEAHPGPSLLATLIAALLVPMVLVALVVSVVGIAAIPLFWIGLVCVGVFGRVVALAWLGGRCLRLANAGIASRPVLDVLAGGVLALALYMAPVLGFIAYVLLGVLGFGAVVYTVLLATRPEPVRPAAGELHPGGANPFGSAPGGASAAAARASTGSPPSAGGPSATAPSPTPTPLPEPAATMAAAEVPDVATLPRAGFWIRMLALLIDLILAGVAVSWLRRGGSGVLLLLAAYGAIMWKLKGTTVGGIVCDLKVMRIDGGPLDWGTVIVRALACFLSLVVAGLGFIWIAIDPEHQAWHDKIAGTVVVRVPKGLALI